MMSEASCRPGTVRKRPRTELQMQIADAVRSHRKSTKLSQEAFADYIGMHRAQYSFIERGIRDIRLSTLQRVADGLKTPTWVILREAEEASQNAAGPLVEPRRVPDRDPPKRLTSSSPVLHPTPERQ